MKVKTIFHILIALVLLPWLLQSCSRRVGEVPEPAPSVYYWKTTFELTESQRNYLSDNGVGKIYLRLFDVVPSAQGAQPHATISFVDTLPSSLTIIPTIFIDYTLFRGDIDCQSLAQLILARVAQMAKTHDFSYREIQFDCDWTQSTQRSYYAFLEAARHIDSSLTLSATIRLHQLSLDPPPVDYGALMLYNTGDFRDFHSSSNPILDVRDVGPYLRHLGRYRLPLCAAYPNFDWNLLYHEGEFRGILYQVDLSDTSLFVATGGNTFTVAMPHDLQVAKGAPSIHLAPGDVVRHWTADTTQLAKVRQMVERQRPQINGQTIIYHLSNE